MNHLEDADSKNLSFRTAKGREKSMRKAEAYRAGGIGSPHVGRSEMTEVHFDIR